MSAKMRDVSGISSEDRDHESSRSRSSARKLRKKKKGLRWGPNENQMNGGAMTM